MQKLKMSFFHLLESLFTCFLKDKTLHNHWDYAGFTVPYYNIPSNNRELQLIARFCCAFPIITYQVITGNYSVVGKIYNSVNIITYQVITGNYSRHNYHAFTWKIITYQVITGNYSLSGICVSPIGIITYQVITGNYSSWRRNPESENIITYQVITGNYSVDSVQT